jgi:signal transduction histidine kinase
LRHEVGDLLQTVYATAAILQERLPPEWELERRIVADLRSRGEACRNLLDIVHDLVCPLLLTAEPVDLADLASTLVAAVSARNPKLEVRAEAEKTPAVVGDSKRIAQVGNLLLANACQNARRQILFRTAPGPGPGEGEWTVTDDGPGTPADQLERLFVPFATTRPGPPTLGLALAHRLVTLHGGRITAENLPGGGFRVRVIFAPAPPKTP